MKKTPKRTRKNTLAADAEIDPYRTHWLLLTPGQRITRSWRMRKQLKDPAAAHDADCLPHLDLPASHGFQFDPGLRYNVSMSKKDILELIRKMPDDVSASQVLEEIYFRVQIEKGLKDVGAGRVLTESRLKTRISKWRKSAGR